MFLVFSLSICLIRVVDQIVKVYPEPFSVSFYHFVLSSYMVQMTFWNLINLKCFLALLLNKIKHNDDETLVEVFGIRSRILVDVFGTRSRIKIPGEKMVLLKKSPPWAGAFKNQLLIPLVLILRFKGARY